MTLKVMLSCESDSDSMRSSSYRIEVSNKIRIQMFALAMLLFGYLLPNDCEGSHKTPAKNTCEINDWH